jgi:ADP-heptose:LPS heptosyltransferase
MKGDPLPPFDFHCPLLSLPLAFGTEVTTIPATERYLAALSTRSALWAGRLDGIDAPRIGLVWSGNIGQSNDANRSMSLETLLPVLKRMEFQFFALVKEVRSADRALMDSLPNVTDLSGHLTDFGETAAILEHLDLLISVYTAVPHLAGALGRPTWIMLSFVPDWRWLLDRADCPWYPGARLFRQRACNDWGSVIASLQAELDRPDGRHCLPRTH